MTRCPWYLAGPLLGLCIVGLRATLNKPLTGLGGFIDLAENAAAPRRLGYRAFLLFGFVLGGALFAATLGSFSFSLSYGTAGGLLPAAPAAQVALLLIAGTLMGFGARTAGGCTGSHGICGTSLGSPASFAAAATFFGTALLLSRLYTLLPGGKP
jgi:uncharacterized membrane protein YedE/YeeE